MLHTTRNEKLLTSYVLILYLILTIGPKQTSGKHQKHENKAEDTSTSPLKTTTALKSMNPTVNSKSIGDATLSSSSSNEPLGGSNTGENYLSANSYNDNNGKLRSIYRTEKLGKDPVGKLEESSSDSPRGENGQRNNQKTDSGRGGSSTEELRPSRTMKNEHAHNSIRMANDQINNLKVSYKDSLKNAVKIIQDLFNNLTKGFYPQGVNEKNRATADQTGTNDGKETINVLVATQTLESFAFEYAKTHLKKNESMIFDKENYKMKIERLATNRTEPLVYYVNNTAHEFGKDWVGIALPPEVLKGKDIAIFVIYNDISQLVPECQALKLQKHIIAGKVHPPPEGNLQENVTISFGRDKKEVDKPRCMFWNFTIKSAFNGSWSRKGCSLVKSDDNETICTCNHLTNFAILMQVGKLEDEDTSKHLVAMEMITYVGCALSLTAEALTIIAYSTLTDFKQEQVQIRLNLVVALASAQIAFLSGIDGFEPKGLCVLVAALIHYFYLVGFAWMFFEGVYLYLMVVKVFNNEIRLRAFYSVAWGCPAGIVVLSIILAACQEGGLHNYINGDFCWVSFSNNLIWTFVAPVLLVCVTNAVLLFLVIHEILKMRSNKAPNAEKLRQAAKACVFLSPLLGMTWAFGILSVTNAGLVFQYIFIVLNSLQGLFIFLLHILRNADIRAEFKRKKRIWFEKAKLLLLKAVCRRG
ncbi:adhesion G protein-coupled receptor L3-like isoform X2 [Acropora muricata]|uniref:adhesion G protein-coupled receptor L3-like isoform X2 n=1 Tax=Acropora muricata TaxID=159855 RepID=UPI0034E44A45